MSEHENTRHEDLDLKEDFSGFTEVSIKDSAENPPQPPLKIDVSEAVAKAQLANANANVPVPQPQPQPHSDAVDSGSGPQQLPEAVERGDPRALQAHLGMIPSHLRPPRPSFWKTLLNRGLTILAVIAVGILVWWWWSKNNGTTGPVEIARAAVNSARKTVVEPIKKALKLPPLL